MGSAAFSEQKALEPGRHYIGDSCGGMESVPTIMGNNEDAEVEITGWTNSGKGLVVQEECEGVTECSSSFGDTGSGSESATTFSDDEVQSQMCCDDDDASSSMCGDDWRELLQARKKTVTVHWRRFIDPLMWRCKWVELRLKQLQSQALKYEKELAAYNYAKKLDFAHLTLDGCGIKSVPISGRMHRNKVMKRNNRKRVEEKCDLASYMSNHSLFSYYEKTDCGVDACLKDCHGVAIGGKNDDDEFMLNYLRSSIDYENDKSLVDIIQKIEAVQSQVQELKTRCDRVISENPGKFCSVNQLTVHRPSDGLNHSDPQTAIFAGHEGIISRIESTDMLELDDPWEDTKDGVLIQNQVAMEELLDFENVEEDKSISEVQVSEPDSTDNDVNNVRSALKSCSTLKSTVPRNKRKGRKKSSSKRWNQRFSG
ncbi:uncharacterized protein LOC130748783 isoform X3 [Lotus japonicus]|nr:uncharacterized protein LOC130748783 isoform X3 [Lotus japonicus]